MYSEDFELFWECYPAKRGGKKAAFKEFEKAVKDGADPKAIIKGAILYTAYIKAQGSENRFICHARTYLHQGRWEDEYPALEKPVKFQTTNERRIEMFHRSGFWPQDWGDKPKAN